MTGNEELKKMMRDLMSKGVSMTGISSGTMQPLNPFGDYGKFRPPLPSVGVDGDI